MHFIIKYVEYKIEIMFHYYHQRFTNLMPSNLGMVLISDNHHCGVYLSARSLYFNIVPIYDDVTKIHVNLDSYMIPFNYSLFNSIYEYLYKYSSTLIINC